MCLQLQSTYNGTLDINQPVLFDKYILNLNNDIIYNDGGLILLVMVLIILVGG